VLRVEVDRLESRVQDGVGTGCGRPGGSWEGEKIFIHDTRERAVAICSCSLPSARLLLLLLPSWVGLLDGTGQRQPLTCSGRFCCACVTTGHCTTLVTGAGELGDSASHQIAFATYSSIFGRWALSMAKSNAKLRRIG
jgi:hypothetical protein